MKSALKIFHFLFLFLFFHSVLASPEIKQRQIQGMEVVLMELETHYGMIKYKDYLFGTTYESLRNKYSAMIRNGQTIEQFYQRIAPEGDSTLSTNEFRELLICLAGEFQDGHLNMIKFGGDSIGLGLYVALIDGKAIITGFDPDIFNKAKVNKQVSLGDEIISMNGVPVRQLVQNMHPYFRQFGGTYTSQMARTYQNLTLRSSEISVFGAREGDVVQIEFQSLDTDGRPQSRYFGNFHWINSSELSANFQFFHDRFPNSNRKKTPDQYRFGQSSTSETHFFQGLKSLGLMPGNVIDYAKLINSELASDEKTKSKQIERIPAYIIRSANKNIGVIRLPNYSPKKKLQDEFNWIAKVVEKI